ncbi:YtcA family lipoprotein [Scandinavium goeteborgense]|uniref:YtcA family lipoprotein n=1 Tax=Scandinavium goeteborgense TaxID=1851514 RepID=UPI000D7BB30F
MRIRLPVLLGLPALFSLSGCSLSPSLPFLGAAFPDWLYCLAGGSVLTGVIFGLAGEKLRDRFQINLGGWLLIVAIISMIIWLFIF